MILKQKVFQKRVKIMKLKETQEKVPHRSIEPACIIKKNCMHGTEQSTAIPTRP